MKKNLLSLLVGVNILLGSSVATAVTVYDNEGSNLDVIGRVKVNLNNNRNDPDHRLSAIARLGVDGKTKVNDHVSVFGQLLYEMAAQDVVSGDDGDNQRFNIYYGWLGFDFNDFGTLTFGHMEDAYYNTHAVTDIYVDLGTQGSIYQGLSDNDYGGRKDGIAKYDLNYNGLILSLSYQFKDKSKYVNYAFGGTLGYEFEIGEQPLGFLVGYNHYDGLKSASNSGWQYEENEGVLERTLYNGADKNETALSVYYGSFGAPGFYAAFLYNFGKLENTYKGNGLEAVLSYTTPGADWTFAGSYATLHNADTKLTGSKLSKLRNSWTGNITYNLTNNFQIYAEAEHRGKAVYQDNSENVATLGLIYNF